MMDVYDALRHAGKILFPLSERFKLSSLQVRKGVVTGQTLPEHMDLTEPPESHDFLPMRQNGDF